jgi:hypothetical protein
VIYKFKSSIVADAGSQEVNLLNDAIKNCSVCTMFQSTQNQQAASIHKCIAIPTSFGMMPGTVPKMTKHKAEIVTSEGTSKRLCVPNPAVSSTTAEPFFLHSSIVALSRSKLARVVGDGTTTQLIIKGICVKGERQIVIGVSKKGLSGNQSFHAPRSKRRDPSRSTR